MEFNGITIATASNHEKSSAFGTFAARPLMMIKEKWKWRKPGISSPNLCDLKVVLSKLEAASIIPLPHGVGYSVQPLSAAINPLNRDQILGIGNCPARKAKRNAGTLTCCLGCTSNSPCKRAKPSECVKTSTKKRKYTKRKGTRVGHTKQLTAENHLSGAGCCSSMPGTTPTQDLNHSAQDSVSPSSPSHSSQTTEQVVSVCLDEVAESPVSTHQVSASSTEYCVDSVSSSPAAGLSNTSLQQVSLYTDNTVGSPLNATNADPYNTEETPVVSCERSTGCSTLVDVLHLSPMPINGTVSSSSDTSMTQISPTSIKNSGVLSSQHNPLPPLPLQQPQVANFPVTPIPSPFYFPLAGQQTGNLPIPWTYNIVFTPPVYPLVQYGGMPSATSSGRVPADVAGGSSLSSNPLTPNIQESEERSADAHSISRHQKFHVSTVSSHPGSHVSMDNPVFSCKEHGLGLTGSNVGQQENPVGLCTTSNEHENDHVSHSYTAAYNVADGSTSVNDESTFSISSLLPDLPNETASSTFQDAANGRQTVPRNRGTVGAACLKLERVLSLVTKRNLEDYEWLLDRYCFDYLRSPSQTGIITGVKSLKTLISRTTLALKTENSKLRKLCSKLDQQIKLHQANIVAETRKYRNALLRKQTEEKSKRVVDQKKPELEEILSKLKVFRSEKSKFQLQWFERRGGVLGSKENLSKAAPNANTLMISKCSSNNMGVTGTAMG